MDLRVVRLAKKLYEVDVGNKKFVRHVDHVLRVRPVWNRELQNEMKTGSTTEEWYDSVHINEPDRTGEEYIRSGGNVIYVFSVN